MQRKNSKILGIKPIIAIFGTFISIISVEFCFAEDNNQLLCSKNKGIWKEFGSGCRGSCLLRRFPEHISCTDAMEMGCECGEGKCWSDDIKKCIKIIPDDLEKRKKIEKQRQKYIKEEQRFLNEINK